MSVELSSNLGLDGVGEKDPSGLVLLWEDEGCSSRFLLDPPAAADESPGEVDGRGGGDFSTSTQREETIPSFLGFFFFFFLAFSFSFSLFLSVSDDGAVASSSSSSTGSSSFLFDVALVFDDEDPDPDDDDEDEEDPGASS